MQSQLLNPENNGKAARLDPEVLEKPVRRQFTAAYKLEMVQAADRCTELGQIGALLRREGLYSSQLSTWRNQRQQGQLQALADNKRGCKATIPHPVQQELAQLRRENQQLRQQNAAGRTDHRYPKKSFAVNGDLSESYPLRRARLNRAAETLALDVGVAPACL
ncbi:transposase [Nodosilinea nodulosa]|uniref:transposase n=1 Tax=Nodosilinea nodulosa TaxID=416001 RepID=UPI00068844AC|nr:helix-turn-helix domain-containing protein [Nodosilinea nodulosa]